MKTLVKRKHSGIVNVKRESDQTELYLHQLEAMNAMDNKILATDKFAGLVVLPTGGGKTTTAVRWALERFINNGKKVLWIAHRHALLEQALSDFKSNAYSSIVNNRAGFKYRIISGQHDRPTNIKKDDDILVASKDSLYRSIHHLVNNWLKYNDDVLLVIDEAHHATAKTYREIIEIVNKNTRKSKILGLTATPFRTAEKERGLLKKVFVDDIIYEVSLRTLISRGILARPIFEKIQTHIPISKLNEEDLKSIEIFNNIPPKIASHIATNKIRNNRIVESYVKNKEEYGKLLVFAINKTHAITLNTLFREKGILSDYVISEGSDMQTEVDLSPRAIKEKIRRFKNGELEVLINVNICTEGTDIPAVQTVFLTRETTSNILMTQMIGRALRGPRAGGTEKAYIVSFVDDWQDKIAWVNPSQLYRGGGDFEEQESSTPAKISRYVSIKSIEEFVKVADSLIKTEELAKLEFGKSIPVGIYSFSLKKKLEEGEKNEENCEILVYDSTQQAYNKFIENLPIIYSNDELREKGYLDADRMIGLARYVACKFFSNIELIPGDLMSDIIDILSYYRTTGLKPVFLKFKDREKYDISKVARHIYVNELGGKRKKDYIDKVWESEETFFKIYFNGNKLYFRKCIDMELLKLEEPEMFDNKQKLSMPA